MPSSKNLNPYPQPLTGQDVEVWKNAAPGSTGILKVDPYGNVRGERIAPGTTTTVTPYERRVNHDRSVSEELDPFLNGRLTPVRLLDDDEDTPVLKANPNTWSETEIKNALKLPAKELKSALEDISNPIVLERMEEVAQSADATVSQIKAIEDRKEEVREKPRRVRVIEDVAKDAREGRVDRPSEVLG